MALAAAMMMTAAMAQEENKPANVDNKRPDRTEMLKRRTDDVVKRYGLNEEQAKKLLELNTKYADKLGGMRGMRFGDRRTRPGGGNGMGPGGGFGADQGNRPQLTEEQRKEMNARREERMKAQKEFDAELKKIMTEEQFKSYTADQEKRESRMRQGGPRRPRGNQDGQQ